VLAQVPGLPARLISTAPDGRGEPLRGSVEEIAEALREFAREGIDEVQIVHSPNTVQGIEGFAPILEALDRG